MYFPSLFSVLLIFQIYSWGFDYRYVFRREIPRLGNFLSFDFTPPFFFTFFSGRNCQRKQCFQAFKTFPVFFVWKQTLTCLAKLPKRDCAVFLTSIQKRSLANATDTDFVIKLVMILKRGDNNDNKTTLKTSCKLTFIFIWSICRECQILKRNFSIKRCKRKKRWKEKKFWRMIMLEYFPAPLVEKMLH